LDGPLPKWCPAVALSRQYGHHSAVALLLKAALIQVSDYRLLGASGYFSNYLIQIISKNAVNCIKAVGVSKNSLSSPMKNICVERFFLFDNFTVYCNFCFHL
jgi:hypothetical protein